MDWLPIIAAVFAVPQFLPQIARVRRTDDVAGVSWTWAALTSVSNAGWIAYFALSRFWTSPAAITAGWAAVLAVAGVVGGRATLGIALTASFVFQVAPSVWTAYRTARPTGIARGTWLLVVGELLCWGVYGPYKSDPRLTVLGWTGVIAGLLMLVRARTAGRGRSLTDASVDSLA